MRTMKINWYNSKGTLYDTRQIYCADDGLNKARLMSKIRGFTVFIQSPKKMFWFKKGRAVKP